jgi:hypothetical protein
MLRPIVIATVVAGTLDILSAFVFAGIAGMGPVAVLRYVASGPFGETPTPTLGWAAVGLAVHYAIMACMAAAYMIVAPRIPALLRHPIVAGLAYGVLLWIVMYWIVKPLRWPEAPLPHTLYGIANALLSHCILVGLPIALIAARHFGDRSKASVIE